MTRQVPEPRRRRTRTDPYLRGVPLAPPGPQLTVGGLSKETRGQRRNTCPPPPRKGPCLAHRPPVHPRQKPTVDVPPVHSPSRVSSGSETSPPDSSVDSCPSRQVSHPSRDGVGSTDVTHRRLSYRNFLTVGSQTDLQILGRRVTSDPGFKSSPGSNPSRAPPEAPGPNEGPRLVHGTGGL